MVRDKFEVEVVENESGTVCIAICPNGFQSIYTPEMSTDELFILKRKVDEYFNKDTEKHYF